MPEEQDQDAARERQRVQSRPADGEVSDDGAADRDEAGVHGPDACQPKGVPGHRSKVPASCPGPHHGSAGPAGSGRRPIRAAPASPRATRRRRPSPTAAGRRRATRCRCRGRPSGSRTRPRGCRAPCRSTRSPRGRSGRRSRGRTSPAPRTGAAPRPSPRPPRAGPASASPGRMSTATMSARPVTTRMSLPCGGSHWKWRPRITPRVERDWLTWTNRVGSPSPSASNAAAWAISANQPRSSGNRRGRTMRTSGMAVGSTVNGTAATSSPGRRPRRGPGR